MYMVLLVIMYLRRVFVYEIRLDVSDKKQLYVEVNLKLTFPVVLHIMSDKGLFYAHFLFGRF